MLYEILFLFFLMKNEVTARFNILKLCFNPNELRNFRIKNAWHMFIRKEHTNRIYG